jgi:predicted acetyltransferase
MSSEDVLVVRPSQPPDHDAVARLVAHGFAANPEHVPATLALAGHENCRVVCNGPDVVGTALLLPMGQYFGNRRVSMTGVAGVAVAPHYQRQGCATTLMRSIVEELNAQGIALSTLYGSALPLYRKAGYECAGSRFVAQIDPKRLGVRERGGILLPMDAAGETRVRALYGAHAPAFPGFLDRSEYIWTRLFHPWGGRTPTCILVSRDDGQVEGYVSYVKERGTGFQHRVIVQDLFATSAWGYRRLWSFLADLCTHVVSGLELHTAPHDPARLVLPDAHFPVTLTDAWMLRLINLEAALGQRGYPPKVDATLDLDIYDDIIDGNNGMWRLTIRDGRGAVRRGGAGDLRTDIRGLAALYSGFANPSALAAAGLLEGTPAALAIAGTVFAASQPWMREMF